MLRSHILTFLLLFAAFKASAQSCDHALSFDGIASYVDCGPGAYYNEKSSLTVEAWVRIINTSGIHIIVGNLDPFIRSGFSMGVQNGQLYCQVIDSNGTMQGFNAGRVAANTWTHLAFTYHRGGRFRGYINGSLIVNFPATANPIGNTGSTNLVIGAPAWSQTQQLFDGFIDEVRIYNFQRSTAQLREDMRLRLNGGAPGLIGYWRFDEGNGTVTQDRSLSNHNGTLMGVQLPLWTQAEGPYGPGSASISSINGTLDFIDEGIAIQPNGAGINDTFVVSRMVCPPNIAPSGILNHTYDYWIVDQYDTTAGLYYDLVFKLGNGSVDSADATNPGNLVLFQRDRFSTGPWIPYASAVYASATDDSVRFNNIRTGGQFMIGTIGPSLLEIRETVLRSRIFPQPADRWLAVDGIDFSTCHELKIYDLSGRCFPVSVNRDSVGTCILDVSKVPDGSYVLHMEGETVACALPVLIHHP